ncbi:RNA 2',3'-cyclic phosphodiesterase [Roseinatronobacter alkalisoli]|uniref:RNA 2',3'-cyclic phosphodiesterase n=1 Tax=Roseinatronobacter alkalisoli TaxID=3028235 RepID=A0ABT5T3M2_9RHOB|nr:RNA 2',3'-cyclic phosphodiesterase [Roseinatronobacter sp. HJB301]MDD7969720.1 RNA 2',3'-cyclic phosphodiesterase [Roseinatronobacter sp. HJB301]
MIRAFLGLELPQHIRSQLVLRQYLLPLQRRIPPENFHITLVFLGDSTLPQLEDLHLALDRLVVPALQLQITGLGLFGKDKPHNLHAVVAPDDGLVRLQAKLVTLARNCGFVLKPRRFHPHVTLSYLRAGSFDRGELEAAVVRDAQFRTEPFAVQEIALFRSVLRPDGAEYDVLERYGPAQGAVSAKGQNL